jgi:hypothetical protein
MILRKKRLFFTPVPDTSVYWDFEDTLVAIITGEYDRPLSTTNMLGGFII